MFDKKIKNPIFYFCILIIKKISAISNDLLQNGRPSGHVELDQLLLGRNGRSPARRLGQKKLAEHERDPGAEKKKANSDGDDGEAEEDGEDGEKEGFGNQEDCRRERRRRRKEERR
jgi:hypothetical protein